MCLPVVYSEISHAPEGHLLYTLLFRASAIYVVAIVIKVFCVFLNGVKTASEKNEHAASHYMTALFQVLKIIIWFIGSIIIISILIDKSPIALLAGLGAAATILMLVFKDTIIGLVAGIQLTVNNMVHVGDWIQMDKAGINGIVEEISLTTVKVRNFDNTITTIPPYTLVSETFQNWQGMVESNGRRTVTSLTIDIKSIGYCTDDIKSRLLNAKLAEENDFTKNTVNLTLFRKSMKCFIEKQPTINPSLTVLVRQLTPTSKGLPIEFYFFTKEKEWSTYENQSDEIIEQIIAQLPLFGLRIYQEPSGFDLQNMLLNKDAKLDLKPEKIS
jgi:miniconductance mechanosensitive channel